MLSNVRICAPDMLDAEDRQRWICAMQANPLLNSPFLHPQFVQLVHQVRPDTKIMIAEDQNARKAWFGFHPLQNGLARPVGAPMSDHQGMVHETGFAIDAAKVLAAAEIGALPFSGWNITDDAWQTHCTHFEDTQLLDISNGSEAYLATQKQTHHKYFKKMRQRARAVVRDHTSANFMVCPNDPELFEQLMHWKHEQYARTGKLNVLEISWIDGLLRQIYQQKDPDFQALLCGYQIGGKWAAAELGLLAGGVYHSWIAAYDHAFSRVSPGLLLLHGVIEQAETLGITQIDLGRGHDHYKKYYASTNRPLAAGCMMQNGPAATQRKIVYALCDGAGKLPLGRLAKLPGRIAGTLDYIGACHPKRADQLRAFGGALRRLVT